ncbi:MAG: tetratricopeptide repeat protein, partial [Candidatus Saccharimonadales bacterium]
MLRLLLMSAVLGLLAAVALAYAPGLGGDFMFDDITNIVRNPFLPLDNLGVHEILRAAFSVRSGPLYRPISMLSFALNLYFFGPHPYSFKLVNVIIHLANALLLLWLTRRLLINCRRRYGFDWSSATLNWASLLIAAA